MTNEVQAFDPNDLLGFPEQKPAVRKWTVDRLKLAFRLIREFWCEEHLLKDTMQGIEMGLWYDQMLYERDCGHAVIYPNDSGVFLLALIQIAFLTPVSIIQQAVCEHVNFVDEGYGGPDSGADAGHCMDCGWSYYVAMY